MWQREVEIPRYKLKAFVNFLTGAVFGALLESLSKGAYVWSLLAVILIVAGILCSRQLQEKEDEWIEETIGNYGGEQ